MYIQEIELKDWNNKEKYKICLTYLIALSPNVKINNMLNIFLDTITHHFGHTTKHVWPRQTAYYPHTGV